MSAAAPPRDSDAPPCGALAAALDARADLVAVLAALGGGPDDPRVGAVWRALRRADAARPAARARLTAALYDVASQL